MNRTVRRKMIILAALFAVISAACLIFFCGKTFKVKADDAIGISLYLPFSESEYYALNTPKDLYADGKITAVNLDSSVLLIYDENGFSSSEGKVGFTALNQIKKLDEKNLLVTDDGSVYKIKVSDFSKTPLTKNETTDPTGGTYFDYNGLYLVTTYSGKLNIYTIDGTKCISSTEQKTVADNSPVAINSKNEIFYIADGKICKRFGENFAETSEIVSATPDKLAANDDFIYYIEGTVIKRVSTAGGLETTLSVKTYPDSNKFGLGNLLSPSGICLNDGKLLISDATGSVQEFSVSDGELVFTGYAIAKNKTAYNRIEENCSDISLVGGKLAAFKGGRLTVIADAENPDYSRKNFENYFSDVNFDGFIPDAFALGENSVLIADTVNRVIKKFDYTEITSTISIETGGQIVDIAYRGGYYFVYLVKGVYGDNSFVYRISEDDFSSAELVLSKELYNNSNLKGLKATVDLLGNIYLSSSENGVYKFTLLSDGTYNDGEGIVGTTSDDLIKMETDLSGALYLLYPDRVTVYNGNGLTDFNLPITAKSFCLSFDSAKVFITAENDERLYATFDLPNTCIKDADIPAGYKLRGDCANIDDLKIYSADSSANVYQIQADAITGKFIYSGKTQTDGSKEFLFICNLVIPAPVGGRDAKLSVFAVKIDGADKIVVIDDRQAKIIEDKIHDADIDSAYIATSVSAYYYPVITEHDDFCLISDSGAVRLKKGTPIATYYTVTLAGTPYYYASFTAGENTLYAYIPINFTVEIPSEYDTNETFVVREVKETAVYSDGDMTDKIATVLGGTKIKVYSTENGVSYIGYTDGNGDIIKGFISADAVINPPDNTLRNVLIIVCVAAAVASTSVFFILKKKD